VRSICRVAFLLVVPLALVSPTRGEEKENPIEAEVKASLKGPARPFTMLLRVKVKDGAGKKFEAAFAKAAAGTRKEKGNKAYELNRSAKSPNEYIVYERWQNVAALQAHLKAPHITTLLAEIGDLLDGPPEVKVFVPVGH
jgi:quinol monooxygenase YgiN